MKQSLFPIHFVHILESTGSASSKQYQVVALMSTSQSGRYFHCQPLVLINLHRSIHAIDKF